MCFSKTRDKNFVPLGILLKSGLSNLIRRLKHGWSNFRSRKNQTGDLTKKQVLRLSTNRRFPTWAQWKRLPTVLSEIEKKVLRIAFAIGTISFVTLASWWLVSHRTEVPMVGGSYTEGLVGSPQFINPLYSSTSDVDSDLVSLIYSGLFKWTQSDGLQLDLAESYTVSEDQKAYTIKLRDNAVWHNGDPVRSSDVLFTIQSIQDPAYHSPLAVSFRGITVSEVDELTVQFVLDEPFAPFLSSLTVGILPSAIWAELPAKNIPLTSFNLSPIGSGPYKFEKYSVEKNGEIKSYSLVRNPAYYSEPPKIEHLIFKFYNDATAAVAALQNQNIEGIGFVPNYLIEELSKNKSINLFYPSMPQAVALFFNYETQPLLKEEEIKQALSLIIDKDQIINEALGGKGTKINSPILPGALGYDAAAGQITLDSARAIALLDETDYTQTSSEGYRAKTVKKTENGTTVEALEELTLTLTVINQPTFIKVAEVIAVQAKSIGIKIQTEVIEPNSLYSEVIKPRAYQILLTATQYDLDSDPYPFWHSSQIKDPGLNLSLYSNRTVDELLEKARTTNNPDERATAYNEFQTQIIEDLPAIFLYQPAYTYAVSSKIKNLSLEKIQSPADRFQNITGWYIKTRNIIK